MKVGRLFLFWLFSGVLARFSVEGYKDYSFVTSGSRGDDRCGSMGFEHNFQ